MFGKYSAEINTQIQRTCNCKGYIQLHDTCVHVSRVGQNNVYTVYIPYVHGSTAPPEKTNILWCNRPTTPPENNFIFQLCTATAPPPTLPHSKNGVHSAGASSRVQAGLGLSVQGVLGGFLTTHRSHCSKNCNFRYRPTTAPFRNNYLLNHRPVISPIKKQ
jgi:hypothetical protein